MADVRGINKENVERWDAGTRGGGNEYCKGVRRKYFL